MRILHVGNFGSRAKGAFLHSVAPKISRGLVKLGHQVVDFADRDAARAGTLLGVAQVRRGARRTGRWPGWRRTCGRTCCCWAMRTPYAPETVADLRRALPAMRVLQWNVDPMFEPDNVARLLGKTGGGGCHPRLHRRRGAGAAAPARHGAGLPAEPGRFRGGERPRGPGAADLPFDLFFACGHPSRPRRALFGQNWDMEDFVAELRRLAPRGAVLRLAGLAGAPHLAGAAYQDALVALCRRAEREPAPGRAALHQRQGRRT